jgi:hypothetical protein
MMVLLPSAKVDASAAIDYSKLNLATSIVNADISTTAAIATNKLGTGAVLQVVNNYDATTSTTSATFTDIFGSDLSITLSSTSNKVLIIANAGLGRASNSGGAADCQVELRVVNTTTGTDVAPRSNATRVRAQSVADINGTLNVTVIDDATFSTTTQTYNVQFKRGGGNDAVFADNLQVLIIEIAG